MGKVCDLINELKPVMMMVTAQIAMAGANILYKLAGNNGWSLRVLIAYRFLFAAAFIVPIALIFERKNRPELTWKIVTQAFICALFGGTMAQNLFAESLVLTSATFVAAMTNLIPAVTFILGIFFGLERLRLNTKAGQAKVTGTVLCIGGAMLLTFYKGCEIKLWSTHFDLKQPGGHVAAAHHKSIDNILGPLMALACCLSLSIALIVQAKMSKKYPCPYSCTALISIMASIQAIGYALCMERDWSQWKLGWNLKLLTFAYMGIVASGIVWIFNMLCVKMRGPLFVSVFNPLLLVFVALAGSLLLNEKLYLGSMFGAATIICGLYSVLWGGNKEMNFKETTEVSRNSEDESLKGFNHGSIVMDATPNFVVDPEIIEVFGEDEDNELEANNVCNPNQIKPST